MSLKTIVALASSPVNEAQLRLAAEFRDMTTQLNLGNRRSEFAMQHVMATRYEDLDRVLQQTSPYLVHFSGHGSGTGLCLENTMGKAELIKNETLITLFSSHPSVKCIILNACLSSEQAEALAGRLDYVIGMSESVSDNAAKAFAEGFYRSLGEAGDILRAFKTGANAVQHKYPDEKCTPELWHGGLVSSLAKKK